MGFEVFGLGFEVFGLGFEVFGLGFEVFGIGIEVFGMGFEVFGGRCLGTQATVPEVAQGFIMHHTSCIIHNASCIRVIHHTYEHKSVHI